MQKTKTIDGFTIICMLLTLSPMLLPFAYLLKYNSVPLTLAGFIDFGIYVKTDFLLFGIPLILAVIALAIHFLLNKYNIIEKIPFTLFILLKISPIILSFMFAASAFSYSFSPI